MKVKKTVNNSLIYGSKSMLTNDSAGSTTKHPAITSDTQHTDNTTSKNNLKDLALRSVWHISRLIDMTTDKQNEGEKAHHSFYVF